MFSPLLPFRITAVPLLVIFLILTALPILAAEPGPAGDDADIIDRWGHVAPPAPVTLSSVTVDPAHTAFLVLDIETRTCNPERRPRCLVTVPRIVRFLERARAAKMPVVYSLTPKGTPDTILPPAAPKPGEPAVNSSVDKFFQTDLEAILREKGATTVIIAGTAAEGAVLHTATAAAMRGFQMIVAVDGMSSSDLYAEQYTAWHLLNAPGTRNKTLLSRFDMIGF